MNFTGTVGYSRNSNKCIISNLLPVAIGHAIAITAPFANVDKHVAYPVLDNTVVGI